MSENRLRWLAFKRAPGPSQLFKGRYMGHRGGGRCRADGGTLSEDRLRYLETLSHQRRSTKQLHRFLVIPRDAYEFATFAR